MGQGGWGVSGIRINISKIPNCGQKKMCPKFEINMTVSVYLAKYAFLYTQNKAIFLNKGDNGIIPDSGHLKFLIADTS